MEECTSDCFVPTHVLKIDLSALIGDNSHPAGTKVMHIENEYPIPRGAIEVMVEGASHSMLVPVDAVELIVGDE